MARPNRIPLFPLDVVLMPGAELPLHIFEPRYKVMIGRCLDERIEFGIILAANKAVAALGCTAEVVRKVRDYPDGRVDILATGRAVFRLLELLDEKEYYEGVVEYVQDGVYAHDGDQRAQLVQLFEKCHALLFSSPWINDDEADEATLAYRLAALLPVELEKRQTLLEIRSEHERRELLLRWMERFVPKLLAQQKTRQRASGNGHSRN
jgi:Lon protease-like protein